MAYGALLVQGLHIRYPPAKPPAAPVRIALISARAAAVGEAPPPVLPTLPIEAPPITPAQVNSIRPVPPPPVIENSKRASNGPKPPVAAQGGTQVDPGQKDPYAELRGRTYPEQPGGSVLVLAVLLDRHGHVYNAKIMVPSGNPLGDLTQLLSLPGTTLSEVPQIPVGQKRWIDLRFRYESQTVALP